MNASEIRMNACDPVPKPTINDDLLGRTLSEVFGFSEFRPHQKALVSGLLENRDLFAVMPTGGGKSLCYQLPSVLSDGCAVVVSPLIALMKDQVDAARANGIRAACVHSGLAEEDRIRAATAYRDGALDLLYVAPERLALDRMVNSLHACPRGGPAFFAIDEAHCISEWGHDFRPDYLALSKLRHAFPETPIAAFTATATRPVAEDIRSRLRLRDPLQVRASFDRHNLFYEVRLKRDWEAQLVTFLRQREGQSGIVYRTTRKSVEATTNLLRANGIDARAYHAGMDSRERTEAQDAFIRDDVRVMVATVAFGMGIDKADVRYVVHADLPKNVESYYQETGRAGRDGEPSHCLLLYGPGDAVKLRRLIDQVADEEERDRALRLLRNMEGFASVPACRRRALLAYFDEVFERENCGSCDFCKGEFRVEEATRDAQILLSAIARTGERFGGVHLCDVVTGANTAKVRQFRHEEVKTYGLGKDRPKKHWRGLLDALVHEGLVRLSDETFPVPKLTPEAWEVMRGTRGFHRMVDTRTEPERLDRLQERELEADCHDGLFEDLKGLRKRLADDQGVPPYVVMADRSLRQLATRMPSSSDELLRIHGIGQHRCQAYGDAFLVAIRAFLAENPEAADARLPIPEPRPEPLRIRRPLSPTYLETLEFLRQGLDLPEIAERRGLALGTVETHVVRLIENGENIDRRRFLSEETEALARHLLEKHGPLGSTPIIAEADGKLSYGQVRIVRAFLEMEESVSGPVTGPSRT